ncbi:MAG: class I SAM-dependent RNA methyltransferase [Anaerolineae bacterium]
MVAMETITLELTGIAHGGQAFGRHEGKIVFVPYALPGETCRVRIADERKKWARAELVEVLTPSPDRIDPPCPYFGPKRCGGCHWQHITYERQLALKREVVVDQIQRLGHLVDPPVQPVMPVGEPWAYRNHAQFAVGQDGTLGFYRAGSHDVISVDQCLLLHPLVSELRDAVDLGDDAADVVGWLSRISLRAGVRTGQQMITFEVTTDELPELEVSMPVSCACQTADGRVHPLIGPPHIEEEVAGHRYRISAGSFFQVNTPGAEALVNQVRAYLQPEQGETLLDIYCGVGLFGLALSSEVGRVIGIEASPTACEDFAWNARKLAPEQVELHEGPAEEVLPVLHEPVDLVVVDPPRSGVGEEAIRHIARLGPRRLAYVSCDPATLARDVEHLQRHGYTLVEVQPIDLFPQTFHIETVSLWVRQENRSA